jgi:hypothetical protein
MKITLDQVLYKRYKPFDDKLGIQLTLTERDCQMLIDGLELLDAASGDVKIYDHVGSLQALLEGVAGDGNADLNSLDPIRSEG